MREKIHALFRYLNGFHVSLYAANASFYIVMAAFPMLALLLTLLRFLPFTEADLLGMVSPLLPEALIPVVRFIVDDLRSVNAAAAIFVTAIFALWSASRGVFGILTGLNEILGSAENRSYLHRRMTAIFYTFLLALSILLTLGIQVFGEKLLSLLALHHSRYLKLAAQVLRSRYWFSGGLLTLEFMLIFAVFPARRMHLCNVVWGALFSSVGWMVSSALFSVYVNLGGGSRFYGSMTLLLLTMLWLYICVSILFYGGVICRLSIESRCSLRALRSFFKKQ